MQSPAAPVRPAMDADISAITSIYVHYVLRTCSSFETEPPDAGEMARRRSHVLEHGLPYVVADVNGSIAGYAYAAPYRSRKAYRYTVEDSIFVHPDFTRRGIGRALLHHVIDACTTGGFRQMIAVIGNGQNHASISLHSSLGFREVGRLLGVGFKFGQWIDTVLMQRALGGEGTLP